ncbi:MAG TPA: TIGR01777 family oxidoreductase [Kiritimatiellia bacterium]|nr:TIGR01777 family oxidoreductase [Kiritimatiellia bacterium]
MKVLVTGSNGLIGRELVTRLTGAGHFVVRMVRDNPDRARGDIMWDPVTGHIERASMIGLDAVIHLAGESILGLWTKAKLERIHKSRVVATGYLAEALASLSPRPKTLISASAVGYYGDRDDERLTEESPAGKGYLPQLCREWEDATAIARNSGIRVVNTRIGIVLSSRGGALASMLPPFKMGIGGTIGLGRHYMSWITLDDLVDAMIYILENEKVTGPANLTSPQPVTNKEFTKTLGRVLRRPTILPVPSPILKLLPGNMANETFLSSARVEPAKLIRAGFKFQNPDLENALQALIG